MMLLGADGLSVRKTAERIGVSSMSVFRWRKRFAAEGIAGLSDRPRSGQPRKMTPAKAKEVLSLTTDRIPKEATHWSPRMMGKYAEVTAHQVRQVWMAADLRPHRLKTFEISNDPRFAEKVVDVVGLYLHPPANAVVLSVDEQTQIQALDRTQPMLPLRPGQVARRTHDYERHGTVSLYAAFDIASGKVLGRVIRRHRAKEFLAFLRQIDEAVPECLDLHLIRDNSSTHTTPEVKAFPEKPPRLELHFTPTSASWLNSVEEWFSLLERRSVRPNAFTSVEALRRFIAAHNAETEQNQANVTPARSGRGGPHPPRT